MAKKKQLAGKKTRLARLPLTQVLASQTEDSAPWGPPLPPALSGSRQLSPPREKAAEGGAGPLAATYLYLCQELAALRSQLQPAAAGPPENAVLPPLLPDPHRINLALKQARKGLQDLYRLLSQG